jgi:hypothetical protein
MSSYKAKAAKRTVISLMEIIVEALLLGCLFGGLIATQIGLLYGVIAGVMAVPVVLFLTWYYLTRVLVGLACRSQTWWLYPAIVVTVFVIHTYIIFFRLKPDFTLEARSLELPFLIGGTCITFACAYCGNRLLRKWVQAASKPSPRQG